MGQGFVLINYDKKEFVSPHDLGLGYKLGEFGYHPSFYSGNKPDFQGSLIQFARDLMETRWQGDRVALVGDYGDVFPLSGDTTDIDNSDGEYYSNAYDTFTRIDKGVVRSWVAGKVNPDNLAFRETLWARHDELDEHFATK